MKLRQNKRYKDKSNNFRQFIELIHCVIILKLFMPPMPKFTPKSTKSVHTADIAEYIMFTFGSSSHQWPQFIFTSFDITETISNLNVKL